MNKLLVLSTLFWVTFAAAGESETLQTWQRIAAEEDENVKSDNNNVYDPDFLTFYQQKDPSFFGLVLVRLGLAEPLWDPLKMAPLLKRVTKERQVKKNKRVEALVVKPYTRIFLVGNLHGAFHSFMRDLTEAKKLGLIDERLHIVNPDDNVVFLGDVINGSPYSLLLIELVVTLMEKNPHNVFYLRGKQETDGDWANYFSVRSQLKRWGYFWYRGKGMPLATELNQFFDTLPDILVISHVQQRAESVILGLSATRFVHDKRDDVQAYIFGEEPLRAPFRVKALDFCRFEKGVATWSLLSSPTQGYQEILHFKDDSFALLEVGKCLRDSLIVSYCQDAQKKDGFKKEAYVVSLGLPVASDIPDKEYPTHSIAATGHLSGSSVLLGRATNKGIEAAIRRTNREGGVNGIYLKPLVLDDQYTPHMTREYVDMLIDVLKVNSLLCPSGSRTLTAYIKRVLKGEINVFFPITGGPQFRTPDITHIVHFRPSYDTEVNVLIEHLTKEYFSKNFVFMFENDAYGIPLVKAAHEALEKRGIKNWIDIPFSTDQTTFDEEVKKMLDADPEAIGLFFSSTSLARSFLSKLGVPFLLGKHLFSNGFLMDETFRIFMKNTGLAVTFSFIVPDPWESKLAIAKEYRDEIERDQDIIDLNSLESYIGTSIFIESMKHTASPFDGNDIRGFMEQMYEYPFKGLTLSFYPEIRGFKLPIWILNEEGVWVEYKQ